jgi:fumarate reductase subunit C
MQLSTMYVYIYIIVTYEMFGVTNNNEFWIRWIDSVDSQIVTTNNYNTLKITLTIGRRNYN